MISLYQTYSCYMEQVTGFEPVSSRWQRDIIALILYLQVLTLYNNHLKIASRILKLFRINNFKITFIINRKFNFFKSNFERPKIFY